MIDEAVKATNSAGRRVETEAIKMEKMGHVLNKTGHTLGYTVDHLADSTGNLIGQMRAMAALESPFGGLKEGIALAAEAEKSSVAFGVMLQDMKKGFQLEQDILKMAPETTLKPSGIQQATKMLLQFNAANENTVLPTIKMLGDTAGGSQERLMSMSLAFGQMSASGRLMGQDLLQMINAGFNPLQEISRTTGKSVSELRDEMEKGTISVEMVKNAFKTATTEGGRFKDGMQQGAKTLEGSWMKLEASIEAVKRSIGTTVIEEFKLKEAINETTKAANEVSKFLKDVNPVLKTLLAIVGLVAAGFGSLIVVWKVAGIAGGMVLGTTRNMWATLKAATAATLDYVAAIRMETAAQLASASAATVRTQAQTRVAGAGAIAGRLSAAGVVIGGTVLLIEQLPAHKAKLKQWEEALRGVAAAENELTDAVNKTIAANQEQVKGLGGSGTNQGRAELEEELRQRTQLMGQEAGTTRSQGELESAKAALNDLRNSTRGFLTGLVPFDTEFDQRVKKAEEAVKGATDRFEAEQKRVQEIKDQLAKPPDQNPEALKELKEYTTRLEFQVQVLRMTADEIEIYKLKQKGLTDTQLTAAKSLQQLNKELEYNKMIEDDRADAMSGLIDKMDDFTHKLKEEIATMGMSSDETELYKMQQLGLDEMYQENIKQLIEMKNNHEWLNKALEEGAHVTEQYATPLEKYSKEVANLNKLFDNGAIDRATYNRAMKEASDNLEQAGVAASKARSEVEKLDNVLKGSAEAKHRIKAFGERLTEQKYSMQDAFHEQVKLAKQGNSGLTQLRPGGQRSQEEILTDILKEMKLQKKNQVIVKPANIGGGAG